MAIYVNNRYMVAPGGGVETNGVYTVTGWVYLTAPSGSQNPINVLGTGSETDQFRWQDYAGDGYIDLTANVPTYQPPISVLGPSAGGYWIRFALVRSGPTLLELYVDGALAAYSTADQTGRSGGGNLYIGGAGNYVLDAMANVKAFTRAITDTTEQDLELAYRNPQGADCVGAWPFVDAATFATDVSGNGNNLGGFGGPVTDAADPAGILGDDPSGATAVLAGTVEPSVAEADIVAGGKTVTLTLTGATWVPD
jgi:hypothetical protein